MSSHDLAKATGNNGNGYSGLPSFFLVGPPRTGTTWLHTILSECALLSHPTKETRFFDKHFHRGLDWYRSHYRKQMNGHMIGEVAPTYFASSDARQRIAQVIPHAKIVCIFRNPVDRVTSLYRLKRAYGMIRWSFDEALVRDPELMESSRYVAHLKEWRNIFGSQLLVMVHDDIEADPQNFLNNLADFIGLQRLTLLLAQIHRVLTSEEMTEPRCYYLTRGAMWIAEWSKAQRLDSILDVAKRMGVMKLFVGGGLAFAEISTSQQTKLREQFRPEIDALEEILNRDLSSWK